MPKWRMEIISSNAQRIRNPIRKSYKLPNMCESFTDGTFREQSKKGIITLEDPCFEGCFVLCAQLQSKFSLLFMYSQLRDNFWQNIQSSELLFGDKMLRRSEAFSVKVC